MLPLALACAYSRQYFGRRVKHLIEIDGLADLYMIPKPKSQELLEQLSALMPERIPSEFQMLKIEREAQKLLTKGVDPVPGRALLGDIAALRHNLDDFLRNYRIAFRLSTNQLLRLNFVVMARRLGCYGEALEVILELARNYPDNIEVLRLARVHSLDCARWDIAKEMEMRLGKLGVSGDQLPVSRFEKTEALVKAQSVTQEQIFERINSVAILLRNNREPLFGNLFDISLDGMVSYGFMVKAPLERIVDLNISIAEHIVARFENTLSEIITISCVTQRDALQTNRLSESSEAIK